MAVGEMMRAGRVLSLLLSSFALACADPVAVSPDDDGGAGGAPAASIVARPVIPQVAAGGQHSCAVGENGIVHCWGSNVYGQVGSGTGEDIIPRATPVATSLTFRAVSAGVDHSCAIERLKGLAYCWGNNSKGQLGTGNLIAVAAPTPVATSLGFTSISAGNGFTCAIGYDYRMYCWGDNSSGQFGDGTTRSASKPAKAAPLYYFAAVAAGSKHACGLRYEDRRALCWGAGGLLGDGSTSQSLVPVGVKGAYKYASIDAGDKHTCAVEQETRRGFCWGDPTWGRLGTGISPGYYISSSWAEAHPGYGLSPLPVKGEYSWWHIDAGNRGTCGIVRADFDEDLGYRAMCWGTDEQGEVGSAEGIGYEVAEPYRVSGEGAWLSAVSRGGTHACGINLTGVWLCWGWYSSGQLGTMGSGSGGSWYTTPVRVQF